MVNLPSVENQLHSLLTEAYSPIHLDIDNQSHLHQYHQGSPNTGESHFEVLLVSNEFEGVSRVARQRMVYKTVADLLKGPVHALSLQCRTPNEHTALNKA